MYICMQQYAESNMQEYVYIGKVEICKYVR